METIIDFWQHWFYLPALYDIVYKLASNWDHVAFIQKWGYLVVFLGSLVEGESIVLFTSAMAKEGYLNIYKVGVIAFFGTLIADQGLYFVGWFYGDRIFARFPSLKRKAEKAFGLLHKYDAMFIIACRFIYGIRITSPIVIGAAKIKPSRFVPLNFISAIIWAVVSCTGGYLLGAVMKEIFEWFFDVQKYLFAGVVVFGVLVWAALKLRRHLKNHDSNVG